jgi:hypothetical protein
LKKRGRVRIKKKSAQGYVESLTRTISRGLMLFGNSALRLMRINARARQSRNSLMLVEGRVRVPSERAARLPRGHRAASLEKEDFWRRSAGLFDPKFAPPLRAYLAVDQRTGIRLLEQRAVAALLIPLWGILVSNRRLAHFRGSLLNRQQQCGGSRRAPCAV